MAPTTLAQSTIYYSYGFTSSSSCTGPPASITKYIVVNTSTTRSSTGDTAPYLLNAGVYPDDPCGLLADHSFSKARVLAETQDCCFHYMFTKGVGGMYHSAVNTRNREKGFDKGLDEVYCETMGDAGASLFVRRNECVPFTYGDGSLYCNGTSLVLFSRFQCMGASETFGWKEGGMVDSKILGRFQMGSSGWTSGIVEKSRLINPGWIAETGPWFFDTSDPTQFAALFSLLTSLSLNFTGFAYAIHLLYSYGTNLLSLFRVVVHGFWVAAFALRILTCVFDRNTGLVGVIYSMYFVMYGLATLLTALYTLAFLFYFFRPGVGVLLASVWAIIVIHASLAGSIYFGFSDTSGVWHKFFSFWLVLMFLFDLVPIYCIIYGLVRPRTRWLGELIVDVHAANPYFWLVALLDILCISLFIVLGVYAGFTAGPGSDVHMVMLIHLTCLPESLHVLCTVYLTGAIRDILSHLVKNSEYSSRTSAGSGEVVVDKSSQDKIHEMSEDLIVKEKEKLNEKVEVIEEDFMKSARSTEFSYPAAAAANTAGRFDSSFLDLASSESSTASSNSLPSRSNDPPV